MKIPTKKQIRKAAEKSNEMQRETVLMAPLGNYHLGNYHFIERVLNNFKNKKIGYSEAIHCITEKYEQDISNPKFKKEQIKSWREVKCGMTVAGNSFGFENDTDEKFISHLIDLAIAEGQRQQRELPLSISEWENMGEKYAFFKFFKKKAYEQGRKEAEEKCKKYLEEMRNCERCKVGACNKPLCKHYHSICSAHK